METIGDKIKGLRKSKGLSLMELANKLNVSDTAISKIETGKTKSITIELGKGLCNELGVSFNELFEIKTDGPDIEKMQTELINLNSVLKDKNDRIEEKEKIIHLQEQVNQNLRNAIIEANNYVSFVTISDLQKEVDNEKYFTIAANILANSHVEFIKFLIEWGCVSENDIAVIQEKKVGYIVSKIEAVKKS